MQATEKIFELDLDSLKIRVSQHLIGRQTVFRIVFSDNRPPLVITSATDAAKEKFWTSIPEGRLDEAIHIGEHIDSYLNDR